MKQPEPGMRVVGIRGALVGFVVEVGEGCIKVEPEGLPAIWLSSDAVIGVERSTVELICDSSEVGRYQVDSPSD